MWLELTWSWILPGRSLYHSLVSGTSWQTVGICCLNPYRLAAGQRERGRVSWSFGLSEFSELCSDSSIAERCIAVLQYTWQDRILPVVAKAGFSVQIAELSPFSVGSFVIKLARYSMGNIIQVWEVYCETKDFKCKLSGFDLQENQTSEERLQQEPSNNIIPFLPLPCFMAFCQIVIALLAKVSHARWFNLTVWWTMKRGRDFTGLLPW